MQISNIGNIIGLTIMIYFIFIWFGRISKLHRISLNLRLDNAQNPINKKVYTLGFIGSAIIMTIYATIRDFKSSPHWGFLSLLIIFIGVAWLIMKGQVPIDMNVQKYDKLINNHQHHTIKALNVKYYRNLCSLFIGFAIIAIGFGVMTSTSHAQDVSRHALTERINHIDDTIQDLQREQKIDNIYFSEHKHTKAEIGDQLDKNQKTNELIKQLSQQKPKLINERQNYFFDHLL